GACGTRGMVVRILPREVVILGQKCQIASFNRTAFNSFGKQQNANAPLCFGCASSAVDALDYMARSERHHRVLVRKPKGNGLHDQLAVYWLKRAITSTYGGRTYDFEELLGALVHQEIGSQNGPPAEISQLEALLQTPWTGDEHALSVEGNSFHLAVLSANQGRLVVREWFSTSI
ncbi:MAG: type I-C CRISPR-associated protein Cas8c/Csd1, partial [Thermoleophilia bacterium]|nr:type I-C CRISPR-associated protein Cas8c/Csd1 [Thermoleophilia bacterium]